MNRSLQHSPTSPLSDAFPALLQRAGKNACFAADEFFSAKISNPHTRRAYARPVGRFLAWCEEQGIELRLSLPSENVLNVPSRNVLLTESPWKGEQARASGAHRGDTPADTLS